MQKGYKSIFNFKASVYHIVPENRMSPEYFKRRAFAHGISDSYSRIRSQGETGTNKKDVFSCFKDVLRQLKQIFYAGKKTYASRLKITQSLIYFRLLQELRASYCKGYAYHQNMARENPVLLEWILKRHYY